MGNLAGGSVPPARLYYGTMYNTQAIAFRLLRGFVLGEVGKAGHSGSVWGW